MAKVVACSRGASAAKPALAEAGPFSIFTNRRLAMCYVCRLFCLGLCVPRQAQKAINPFPPLLWSLNGACRSPIHFCRCEAMLATGSSQRNDADGAPQFDAGGPALPARLLEVDVVVVVVVRR